MIRGWRIATPVKAIKVDNNMLYCMHVLYDLEGYAGLDSSSLASTSEIVTVMTIGGRSG